MFSLLKMLKSNKVIWHNTDDLSINYLPILVPRDFDEILVCTSFGSPFYACCPGNVCCCVLHEGESFAISGTYQRREYVLNLWNTLTKGQAYEI